MVENHLLNNRYELERSLGSGGMAVVYQARDLMLERNVAIKVLREDFSSNPDFRERFRQEAKSAANLSHPNIVTIHDFGLDGGRLFLVMENVPGTDLKTLLQKRNRFSVEETLSIMIQACAGIGYAHRAGLVHCDVKPHNMLVTPDKRLKVADFGIARALASIRPDEKISVIWGSPQYFSPEQASGEPPSPASDVYSLGIVMYEMLTGQLPFIATSASDLARLHREVKPSSPRSINPAIPAALDRVILKILSKEPSARYRTADQLGRVLMNMREPVLVESKPASTDDGEAQHGDAQDLSPAVTPERVFNGRPKIKPAAPVHHLEVDEGPLRKSTLQENPLDIDWTTWVLGLLALIAVGGLIPFWLWIYLTYNPPAP